MAMFAGKNDKLCRKSEKAIMHARRGPPPTLLSMKRYPRATRAIDHAGLEESHSSTSLQKRAFLPRASPKMSVNAVA